MSGPFTAAQLLEVALVGFFGALSPTIAAWMFGKDVSFLIVALCASFGEVLGYVLARLFKETLESRLPSSGL
jgi:hypothetical protein